MAQDAGVGHLVAVLQRPVAGVVLVGLVVHVGAELAQRVAVHRLDRVMVHLRPVIADRARDRAPAVETEVVLHRLARAVQPAHRVGKAVLEMLVLDGRPMDAELPVFGIELEQRLDAPALVPVGGRGAGVLFRHGRARPVHDPVRAEDAPGHDDAVRVPRHGIVQHPVQRPRRVIDRQELVGVEDQHPVGILHQRLVLGVVQGRGLGLHPLRDDVVAVVAEAEFFQPLQDLDGAVGAVVGVDKDVGEAHGKVVREPFQQERCLVLHHRHGHHRAVGAFMLLQLHLGPSILPAPLSPRARSARDRSGPPARRAA